MVNGWDKPAIDDADCKLYIVDGSLYKECRNKFGDEIWYEVVVSTKRDFDINNEFDPELAIVPYEEGIAQSEGSVGNEVIKAHNYTFYNHAYHLCRDNPKYIETWSTTVEGVLRKISHVKKNSRNGF